MINAQTAQGDVLSCYHAIVYFVRTNAASNIHTLLQIEPSRSEPDDVDHVIQCKLKLLCHDEMKCSRVLYPIITYLSANPLAIILSLLFLLLLEEDEKKAYQHLDCCEILIVASSTLKLPKATPLALCVNTLVLAI